MSTQQNDQLLAAALAFDIPQVGALVKAGARSEYAFLSDQAGYLGTDDDLAEQRRERLRQLGMEEFSEEDVLFELYASLIENGHPIPDESGRRAFVRIICGCSSHLHDRSARIMSTAIEQGLLDWETSAWAHSIEEETRKSENTSSIVPTPLSNPYELFNDAMRKASAMGNLPVLHKLVEYAGNDPAKIIERCKSFGRLSTPPMEAAMNGQQQTLDYLFQVMPEPQWGAGCTPAIIMAAGGGHELLVRHLVSQGHDINTVYDAHHFNTGSCLTSALHNRSFGIVPALLEMGCNPNGPEGAMAPPLHLALHFDASFVPALIQHGANPNATDSGGMPAIVKAAQVGEAPSIALLLDHGADINARDQQGNTAIIWACGNARMECIDVLHARGADMNAQDNEGKTALMACVKRDNIELWEKLVSLGCDPHVVDKKGQTAAKMAQGQLAAYLSRQVLDTQTQATVGAKRPRRRV